MTIEFGIALSRVGGVKEQAQQLEAMGFDFLAVGEHVSFNVAVSNSLISLATAAGATTRIKLMSTIVLVPLYPAALLAKLVASLDVASEGRYHFGIGVGGEIAHEFEACGIPLKERGARTDEALGLLKRLWTERNVDFEGRFNTLHGVTIDPPPVQQPHPPIWVAGRQEVAMRRAARYADGWLPYMYTPEQLASSLERINAERDTPIRPGLFIFATVHEDGDEARRRCIERLSKQYAQDFSKLVDRYALAGTPDEVRARLQEYLDAGAETVIMSSACHQNDVDANHALLAAEIVGRYGSANG